MPSNASTANRKEFFKKLISALEAMQQHFTQTQAMEQWVVEVNDLFQKYDLTFKDELVQAKRQYDLAVVEPKKQYEENFSVTIPNLPPSKNLVQWKQAIQAQWNFYITVLQLLQLLDDKIYSVVKDSKKPPLKKKHNK